MKRLTLATLSALFVLACFGSAPADARAICKGGNVKCSKPIYKNTTRAKRSHYAYRRSTAPGHRVARARGDYVWQGWAGSFHLDGARYPGGNPVGPAAYYNNYEGGFHDTVFWKLSDRARY